jgi:MFS family permease
LIADSTPPEQLGAAYGLRQSLDTIGAYLGPLAAFALMASTAQDFRLVFALTLIPGVLAVGLLVIGIQEPEPAYQPKARPKVVDRSVLRRLGQDYWILLAIALIASLGNSSNAFLLLRAGDVGISATWVPLTLVVMNVAYFLSAYPAGAISDRINRAGLLVSSFMLFSLVYGGFALAQSGWQSWGLFALYGIYLGLNKGILPAMVAESVPTELRGTAFGFFNLTVGLCLFLASLVAGALWQTQGAFVAFGVSSGLGALSTLVLLLKIFLTRNVKNVTPPQ